jgi:hypothetical protein
LKIHPDFDDFVAALNSNHVQYMIVGSFALAFHGCPRATGDIDFWIRPTSSNAKNLLRALGDFGFGQLDIDFWIRPTSSNAKNLLRALGDFGFGQLNISEGDVY